MVDAKVVPLLKESKSDCDKHGVLQAVTGLRTRIVPKRDRQNTIKCFMKLLRSCIVSRRSTKNGLTVAAMQSTDTYRLTYGTFRVKLVGLERYGTTKAQCQRSKVIE